MARNQGSDRSLNDAGMGTNFLAQASNKRTMTLDLARPEGRDILRRLVAGADVLVGNYRPGALSGLGLGYRDLSAVNSRLIYGSVSGFGQQGPRAGQRAYDHVIQALSGAMAANGDGKVPTRVGFPAFDYATGTMAAFAISAALFQRERTGRSQPTDVSMLDVALTHIESILTPLPWRPR